MKAILGKVFGALIGGPVGVVGTVAGELVKNWTQGQQQKRELSQTITEYKQVQAMDKDRYTHEWELQALAGSGIWMKRGTLILFSFPLVWAPFDPEGVEQYFEALQVIPEWFLQSYGGMLAVVWGLTELRGWKAGKK